MNYQFDINKTSFRKKIIRLGLFGLVLSAITSFAYAESGLLDSAAPAAEIDGNRYSLLLGKREANRGYTVEAFDKKIRVGFAADVLTRETEVKLEKLNESIPAPDGLVMISSIYQFEVMNKKAYSNNALPIYLHLDYGTSSDRYKQIYFYDKIQGKWRPLPTSDNPAGVAARAPVHLPFVRVAVFSDPKVMGVGKASWYVNKGGLFAASPDFAAGSRLRVVNVNNGKFVDVTVNDYGPDRTAHPDRVVDLDKVAFARLTDVRGGTVSVKIEPLKIVSKIGQESAGSISIAGDPLAINAKSAILVNETTGEIVYEKNSNTVLPLASLTKLVAMKVFLDTNPNLDKVVSYSVQDEEYNYQYVAEKWESARLKVADGDTMTIRDLMYSALVGSANNAVESLVRVSGLPRDAFIVRMNELVREWGAASTRFMEPTGLAPENVSTCSDYAIITREVYKNALIQTMSTAPEYDFTTRRDKLAKHLRNTNQMVANDNYTITGTKTGFLYEAGYCLMVRAKAANGENIIAVTFGANTKAESQNETTRLLDYGLNK